ncbi:MAG: hypothetical protein SNJ84_02850, partial [Verrucomicrobiia bacterium]
MRKSHPNIKVVFFDRKHRWKSASLSFALHAAVLLLIGGAVLIPAPRQKLAEAFSGSFDPTPNPDEIESPLLIEEETVPTELETNLTPPDEPEPPTFDPLEMTEPVASNSSSPGTPKGLENVSEAELVTVTQHSGMGSLIQLPSHLTSAHLLPEAKGHGAGNTFD